MRILILAVAFFLLLPGCESATFSDNRKSELNATDAILRQVDSNALASGIPFAFSIDHSRLAEEAGEVLDASKVSFYIDSEINSRILDNKIRAGLDLPFRILAFYQQGKQGVYYTDADFLRLRHGLDDLSALAGYDQSLSRLTAGVTAAQALDASKVSRDYGIVELESKFGFDESVKRLKQAILAEGDTVWFHDIDYQQQARVNSPSV